ncbi:TPA: hypothetical protein P0E24_003615 [Vibrio campbellii]|uniref:hypothetical protein n=1 Tax=Vibrio anguillarum TaxID=55601 RepID=UPI0016AF3AAA|nr:hypothetical protein [Vibrio anguillarum]NOI05844.1 hypothetical protein [Vibrio anguillarum]HDM8244490.1 hypothetical protein [Vibrio campbellii]
MVEASMSLHKVVFSASVFLLSLSFITFAIDYLVFGERLMPFIRPVAGVGALLFLIGIAISLYFLVRERLESSSPDK